MKTTFMRELDELNAFSGLANVLHNKKITNKDKIKAKSLFIEGLIRFLELYGNNEIGNVEVDIENSLNKGHHTERKSQTPVTAKDVRKIQSRMREIVNQDMPFVREKLTKEEAEELKRLIDSRTEEN